ncbi:branched-chain amino acid ABC transporter ATP-binding protein/permease [Labrys wisconsinensis]|uniref:Branched-chain amino acid transport system permease protein n=1 Tax=Labrys wisconsinensis TaxID=425677 RepID=A0ABU0JG17_9HYPH|nr:ATP-binding cassette domain-containing protein [Labrys wisconsinensis]MDQ0473225.1 branched-chain amino acid transport system permease protein [Labrys wisconsinensis]
MTRAPDHTLLASAPSVPSAGAGWRSLGPLAAVAAWLALTAFVAQSDLSLQSLVLVAAVFGILAISLDLVAGMLGLYSLGQGGFFGIGAYLTTIVSNTDGWPVFWLLPVVLAVTGLVGMAVGAMSLRVSGLYFAITTFIFTLVLTVLVTDMVGLTGGLQGLLGPAFPDFPPALAWLGTPVVWCIMLALLACVGLVWNIRRSPLYPVLLSIRDAEPFAEAAGARTALIKVGIFGLSAAMAGGAGWLFSFLGVVSPSQFDWSVSLNILVMVLIGGINTTLGPLLGAMFVSMFPDLVNINPWLQEIVYGALSILAITLLPDGIVGRVQKLVSPVAGRRAPSGSGRDVAAPQPAAILPAAAPHSSAGEPEVIVECRGIEFGYDLGPKVLRQIDLTVRRGHIHGLIGPNGSGKSTLANVISGRLRPHGGEVLVKGRRVERMPASARSKLGLRRTFQAAQLIKELTLVENVMVGLFDRVPGIVARAGVWPLLPSGRRDSRAMRHHAAEALRLVGAGEWAARPVGDVPHGIEQLTQLASVCVAGPDIIILDEPATGLSAKEVSHLAAILAQLKTRGVTMIIIEHQTRFLFPLCDRVTVLNAGEIILTGSADEVRADPVVRQVYLGE